MPPMWYLRSMSTVSADKETFFCINSFEVTTTSTNVHIIYLLIQQPQLTDSDMGVIKFDDQ